MPCGSLLVVGAAQSRSAHAGDSRGLSLTEGEDRTRWLSVPHPSILCGESHFQRRHPQHRGAAAAWKIPGLLVASWMENSHVHHLCSEERPRDAVRPWGPERLRTCLAGRIAVPWSSCPISVLLEWRALRTGLHRVPLPQFMSTWNLTM